MKKRLLRFIILFAIFYCSCPNPIGHAEENSNQYLRLKYSTIKNPIVQNSSIPQDVTLTAFFQTDNYQISDGDLVCNEDSIEINAVSTMLSSNEFSVSCTYRYDKTSVSALKVISMYSSKPNLIIIPLNAKVIYPVKYRDDFGQIATKNLYAYEIYARGTSLIGFPVAINPPQTYRYPNFQQDLGTYTIFDARIFSTATLNLTINKKTKTFTPSCIGPDTVGLLKETRIPMKILFNGEMGYSPIATNNGGMSYPYTKPSYSGKKLDLSCAYLVGLKDPTLAGLNIAYFESPIKAIQFPTK
jgi:hypothetical protein